MTIQDIKKIDLYKCSRQDINKADKALGSYLDRLIKLGHSTANNWKGSDQYLEAKKLHVLVSRAKRGMDKEGYMLGRNTNKDRLPNSKSVL